MHEIVLAIDPAAKAGAALFVDGKLTAHCELNGSAFWPAYDALDSLLKSAPGEISKMTCVIEEGFATAFASKGSLTLGRRRGLVQAAAEAHGFQELVMVQPNTWQNPMLGYVPKGQTKVASLARVKSQHSLEVSADVADAINLGEWYLSYGLTSTSKGVSVWHDGKRRPPRPTRKALSDLPKAGSVPSVDGARPRKRRRAASPEST
jgi:hypothetical protein